MHVLAFVNEKGGCGKTTTTVHLAGALARAGHRVLAVDLDPQAHATMGLGVGVQDGGPTVADVLLGRAPLLTAVREVPGAFGLRLVPSSAVLAEFEESADRELEPERRLSRELAAVRGEFDFVLVDCPPRAGGVLAANALCAADTAVLVVEAGAFALQGAIKACAILEEAARLQGSEFDVRVLGTMFDRRTRFARELLIAMHARFGERMYDTVIRTSVRLREAAASGQVVHALDPRSRAASDFSALEAEVVREANELTAVREAILRRRAAVVTGTRA